MDAHTAKLVNWCQRMWEHYCEVGDVVNANLVSVWLDELSGSSRSRFYGSGIYADPNPFPKMRWLR